MATGQERYVVAGLARARAEWSSRVSQWATAGAVPVEFLRCVSVGELRARLASERSFSAALLDGGVGGVDRDLVLRATDAGAVVIVVTDDADRRWSDLGVAAVLPPGFTRVELVDTLATVAQTVSRGPVGPGTQPTGEPRPSLGRLVAVVGPGGTGASTIAIAVAQGLAQGERGRVVLADLRRNADQAMLHDTRVVVPGLQELVEAHRTTTPNATQVREQTFDIAARGYRLLLGLRRHRHWVSLRPRATEAALDSLRRSFDLVVADVDVDLEGEAETGSMDVEERNHLARTVTSRADAVVVVGDPGMKGLYAMVRVLGDLVAHGVEPRRLVPVLNRAPRRPRQRAELARTLADLVLTDAGAGDLSGPVFVPDRAVDEALRDGVPLPKPVVAPVAGAVAAALDRAPAKVPEAALVPVAVGSLGFDEREESA